MTENVENLLLEHMKSFQASLDRIEHKIAELPVRVASLESGQAVIMQHLAHCPAGHAAQQVAIDRINDRLDRIGRRPELTN